MVVWFAGREVGGACLPLTDRSRMGICMPGGHHDAVPLRKSVKRPGSELQREYPYGTETKGPILGRTTTVGSCQPNAFGLYDMPGNVWEWCQDWYSIAYYDYSPSEDPAGPATGSHRVVRGGSWNISPGNCRSAGRSRDAPDDRNHYLGLRVALVPVDASGK